MTSLKKLCVILYLIIAWVTLGVSYNLDYDEDPWAENGFRAFSCGAGWPLYWSTKIFKPLRPGYFSENPEKE